MFFGALGVFGERRQLYEAGDGRIPVDKPLLRAVLHNQLPGDNAEKPALSRTPEG